MTRKAAARTQHESGMARTGETEDRAGRKARPAPKRKAHWPEATTPDHGSMTEAPGTGGSQPPPHPALVELVRLMARADARRARAEEKEKW
jgi:hypothetical protein